MESRLPHRLWPLRWHLLAAVALVSFVVAAVAGNQLAGGGAAARTVSSWLTQLAGASEDRGRSYLADHNRDLAYGNDPNKYLAEAEAVEWDAVSWSVASVREYDGVYSVDVSLRQPEGAIPAFLFNRGLVQALCDGERVIGFSVLVHAPLFQSATISSGGRPGPSLASACGGSS